MAWRKTGFGSRAATGGVTGTQRTPAELLAALRTVDGAGSGLDADVAQSLASKAGFPAVVAGDVGKHVVISGVEYIVVSRPTPGHARSVTLSEITDANFIGFFRNQIAAAYSAGATLAADQFYYSTTYGDFEEYVTNPSPGWTGYSPFEVGEPWASVVINGTTINIAPGAHAIPVHGEDAAEPRVTAVGQVFADLDTHRMLVVSEFTEELEIFRNYELEVYRAPGVGGLAQALVSALLGQPTAAKVGWIRDLNGVPYRCAKRGENENVVWQEFAPGSDVGVLWGQQPASLRYRGEVDPGDTVDTPSQGDVFNTPGGSFSEYNQILTDVLIGWKHLRHPDGWINRFRDQAAAEHAVTAVDETAVYGGSLWRVTAYVPGTIHHVWDPVIEAERDRVYLKGSTPLPSPTRANEDVEFVRRTTGTIFVQRHTVVFVTPPVAAYEDQPLVGSGQAGIRGAGRIFPSGGVVGQYWYLPNYEQWYEDQGGQWVPVTPEVVFGDSTTWHGPWETEAEATNHIDAEDDVVYIGTHQGGVLRRVDTFAAGLTASDVRTWVPAGNASTPSGGLDASQIVYDPTGRTNIPSTAQDAQAAIDALDGAAPGTGGGIDLHIASASSWLSAAHSIRLTLPAGTAVLDGDIVVFRSPDDIAGVEDAAIQLGPGAALPLFEPDGVSHVGDDFLPGHIYEVVREGLRWVVVSGAFHDITTSTIHDATSTLWSQAAQRFTWVVAAGDTVKLGDLVAWICPPGVVGTLHPIGRVNNEQHVFLQTVEGDQLASSDFIEGQDYLVRRDMTRFVVVSGEIATTVEVRRGGTGAETETAARASLEIGEGIVRSTAITHDTAQNRLRVTVADTSQIRTGAAVMLGPIPIGLTGSAPLAVRFLDAGATLVADPPLVLRDGTAVTADTLAEGQTHLLLVEPARIVVVGEVGPRSATAQEGVAYSGSGWADWTLYQRAEFAPATVPLWNGSGWDPALADWQTSQTGADLGADLSHTLWIGHGSARIEADGTYIYSPQTITALFDQQFSLDGATLWHLPEVAADDWTRFRLPNGTYSAAIPTTTRASSWVAIVPQQYPVSGNVLETINKTIPAFDVSGFDFIKFLVRPFQDFSNQDNQNHSHTFILARPTEGWPVNDQANRFHLVYRATYGLWVAVKEDGPESSLPAGITGWDNGNQTIRYSFEFRDTDRLVNLRDGQVNAMRFHDQGVTYNRHYLLAWGFAA